MKLLFWLLALFAGAVALTQVAHNSGYVLLVYPPYRAEMSLTAFVLALIATFFSAYLLVRFLSGAINLSEHVKSYRAKNAQSKGQAAMLEALTAFFEGRYAAAEAAAVRAMELGENSGLNSIIAARAANELRDFDKRDAYLADAEGKTVGEQTMRLIAKAEFQLDQKQPHSALSSLKELSDTGMRKHIGALNLELKAQQQARNWDAVLDVANQLVKRNAINATMAIQMRQQAWVEKLRLASNDIEMLRTVWKSVPAEFKQRSKIAAVAAQSFMQLDDCLTSRIVLTDSLNTNWDSEVVALYGDCQQGSVVAQIDQAERWVKQHHDDAGLLLALGKLCLHQELWGKAQNYLDASISIQPSRAAYTTLAQLAEKLHKTDESFRYHQLAAEFA